MKNVCGAIKNVYADYENRYNNYAEKYKASFYQKKLISEVAMNSDAVISQNLITISNLMDDVKVLDQLADIVKMIEEYEVKFKEIFGCESPINLLALNNVICEKYCKLSLGLTRVFSDDFTRIKYQNRLNLESCISTMDAWFLIGEDSRNDIIRIINKRLRAIDAISNYSE